MSEIVQDAGARSGEFVQSLERGLAVIRAFGTDRARMTLSEVAREAELSRASARRFLHTLVELGYVVTDGRVFALRPQVLELGYAYLSSLSLPEVAQPHLEQLVEEVGESSSVAVLDGADIVYVARVATRRIMSAAIQVGTRFPAAATSMGRAVLAHVPDGEREAFLAATTLAPLTSRTITDKGELRAELGTVKEQGWALVDQELEEGLRSIAAPLRDGTGRVVAAVNVSAPVRRGPVEEMTSEFVPALLRAAREIEADLSRTRT
ncbi:IclR family transcriptional regulator domain-containing protein [Promicromonospora iranensis]|uniref:IclR family pca regulon transcriptional regulator n=1 Tax=Promicromonospora iranensis TaxID=1105144 RepID=A0ABU2CQH4_9MICO|nr:IclR family transcriptional regulator C-terminal domain-containing protein [Promicromonospora iranensis]MDR7383521.1 IclR family pca regulon transcriptional regulator [Promicromonospora iranensis]